jgi:hypothetical protein
MMWLAWRQVRTPACAVFLAAALALALLAWTGPQLTHDFRADGLAPCAAGIESTTDRTCGDLVDTFLGKFSILSALGSLLVIAPALVGIFWGAPLVAREYEAGTHQLAWTQSVSRTRWLSVKLATVGTLALGLTALTSLAFTWWSSSRDRLGSRLTPDAFNQRGIVPIAYVAFALVLGVAIGSVVRRVLPAMALKLLVVVVALFGTQRWIRPHLFEPIEVRYATYSFYTDEPPDRIATDHGWMLSNKTLDGGGHVLSPAGELSDVRAAELCGVPPSQLDGADAKRLLDDCGRRLGLVDVVKIHPADRFWPMQTAESALFAAATLPLLAFCFWKLRRAPD